MKIELKTEYAIMLESLIKWRIQDLESIYPGAPECKDSLTAYKNILNELKESIEAEIMYQDAISNEDL